MGLLGLILFGAILGFVADLLDRKHDNSWITNIILGIIGALLGGVLRNVVTDNGTMVFDLASFGWGLVGTLIVLALYHAFAKTRIDDARNRR